MAWWKLTTTDIDPTELQEHQKEQLADLIKKGFTEGELLLEEDQK